MQDRRSQLLRKQMKPHPARIN